jgi:SET domain-containing protein
VKKPLFEVRASPIAGLGVFALRRIRQGTRIIEYVGERISSDEADARYDDDAMEQHHTLLFAVDDDMVIDAAVGGNEARFINHSCAPNCEAVDESGRIYIEAIADIAPGAELLYDYALTRDEPWDDRWSKLYACRCGAATCRGTILKSPTPPRRKRR